MENDKGLGPTSDNNNHSIFVGSKVKKGVLDAGTSVWEGFQYVKAFIVSQVKALINSKYRIGINFNVLIAYFNVVEWKNR